MIFSSIIRIVNIEIEKDFVRRSTKVKRTNSFESNRGDFAEFSGLRSCPEEKHLHVKPHRDYITKLMMRAEPDIEHGRRERHAKTLDVAQEEILTCIGIYLFERFDKLCRLLRSEERTWLLLYSISIDCLRLSKAQRIDRFPIDESFQIWKRPRSPRKISARISIYCVKNFELRIN